MFPERGETKLDLVEYYLAVEEPLDARDGWTAGAHAALPERRRGFVVLPEASARRARPTGLQTEIVSTPNGTTSRALVAADLAHIAWAVNLGCLGFHVWPYARRRSDARRRAAHRPRPPTRRRLRRRARGRAPREGAARRASVWSGIRRPRATVASTSTSASNRGGTRSRCGRRRLPSRGSWRGAIPTRSPTRGGRRSAASGCSSTSTRTRRTRPCSARGRSGLGKARRCRRRSRGTSSTRSCPTS